MLTYWVQQCIKNAMCHDQSGFFLGIQGYCNTRDLISVIKHIINFETYDFDVYEYKAWDAIQHPLKHSFKKNLSKWAIEENVFMINGHLWKSSANIIKKQWNVESFLLRLGKWKRWHLGTNFRKWIHNILKMTRGKKTVIIDSST